MLLLTIFVGVNGLKASGNVKRCFFALIQNFLITYLFPAWLFSLTGHFLIVDIKIMKSHLYFLISVKQQFESFKLIFYIFFHIYPVE